MASAALSPDSTEQQLKIVWQPYPGGQTKFLTCPIKEIFAEGNRGGGKTDTLLMKYLRYVGLGFGAAWTGVIFRREYKHLDDIIKKSKRWIPQLFPGARWLASKGDYKWVFPDGEELLFRVMKDVDAYWSFHGHELPFIGWEELTNWPTDECYEVMKSCSRCSVPGVPKFYISTGNPFGAGHGWVKERFIDIGPEGTVVEDEQGNQRVRINVSLDDNPSIFENDPEYVKQLEGIKNPELKKAWRHGDWDIVVGGFLQGIWDSKIHKVTPFKIPGDWPRWRAMDWGSAKPYSVGWYCMSPEGEIYRYRELYGYGGKPNTGTHENATTVAKAIYKTEAAERKAGIRFLKNPADSAMWSDVGNEQSINDLFKKQKVRWIKSKKGSGSRIIGAQLIIDALTENKFFVFDTCTHWLRTVPVLMPNSSNWEDVDTEMEDHAWDETMYSLRSRHKVLNVEAKDEGPAKGTFAWLEQVTAKKVTRDIE